MKAAAFGGNSTRLSIPDPNLFQNPNRGSLSGSLSGALRGTLGSLDGACIEKLLLHCASALENNDVTLAQQVMWVLNNIASSNGEPNQRLTSWFLRALVSRASRVCPTAMGFHTSSAPLTTARPMAVTELAGYVDLTPWHRFGFSASNGAIYNAIEGHSKVHILDLSITYCMQWPTLIDALAKRPEGPPFLRITVPSARPPVPPLLNVSIDEIGLRLSNFARSRDVPFEFHVIKCDHNAPNSAMESSPPSFYKELTRQLDPSCVDLFRDDETIIVNCQSWLRYLSSSEQEANPCKPFAKDGFLEFIRGLNPHLITITDEDSDLDSPSLASRTMACFNCLWIPFDALETFLPKDSPKRMDYEADFGQKIANIIGFEGAQRIERPESGARVAQRMNGAGFTSIAYSEETVRKVKFVLGEHASGWGMKKEDDMLVLTWKGHSSVFTMAWAPNGFDE